MFVPSFSSFMKFSASLALWAAVAGAANAQATYPAKPVRFVVGYTPGQTVDNFARAAATALTGILGQPMFVDNKPGANGIIAAQEVKAARADGYTLLFGTSGQLAINPSLYKNLPYDPVKNFEPVALLGLVPLYLVVPAASPFHSLTELVSYAKAHPGKLTYGSGGRGITAHLATEMLKKAAGIDIVHVPYKGSVPAMTDLLGGQIDMMMDASGPVIPQIQTGKVRALAISSAQRYPGEPSVPTIAEQGFPGFHVEAWSAVMAPANTPRPIIEKLNKALVQAQKNPAMIKAAQAASSQASTLTVEQFQQFLLSETKKFAAALKLAGIEPE